ncbi:glycine-rich domain-containing protein [Streptomyces sp. NBC_01006]|uniref:glycine-rich domain-containing protein n=1 Tax=Streptomyces sp. NBC_01006 TaxID=2903716 RepID=UPI003864A3F4|nr:hypothetical protein OG509_30555 [Streptomyces sp. NBC_01006]
MTSPSPACSTGPTPPPPPCTGTTATVLSPRALLSDAQFNGVMHTVLDGNPGMEPEMAGRIVVEAIAFLATAAKSTTSLVPSRVVDEGWHALILHTGLYQGLCFRLGGFIHHVPERPDPGRRSQSSVERTVAAMEAAGYTPDRDLWRGPEDTTVSVAADCQHSDDGGTIIITPKPK